MLQFREQAVDARGIGLRAPWAGLRLSNTGVLQQEQSVHHAVKSPRRKQRRFAQFQQSLSESEQHSRQIPAVHTGDIKRQQWFKGAGVVPVVKMPVITLHFFQSGHRVADSLGRDACGQIAKVAGGKIGQKCAADVRRRGAVRGGDGRILLIVVRRQPVILRDNEGFKEPPGLAGRAPQQFLLLNRELRPLLHQRPTQPPCDKRRYQPERQERRCQRQRLRTQPLQDGQDHAPPAAGPPASCGRNRRWRCWRTAALRFRWRFPTPEGPPMREHQVRTTASVRCASSRIHHHVIRQKQQRECRPKCDLAHVIERQAAVPHVFAQVSSRSLPGGAAVPRPMPGWPASAESSAPPASRGPAGPRRSTRSGA